MHFFRLASVFSLALVAVAQDISIRAVKRAFNAANIPNDLDIVFRPTALLEVSLPQAAGAPITLHAGIQVPRNDVGHGPFVVATVDPDAPTPQAPTEAQIRHFLGGNFFNEGGRLVNSTPAVSEFLQPTPPAGSDAHRYIFLLFDQSPQFARQTLVNATTSVALFNINQFASAVDLGNPLAGTFMLVAPEPDA
ncbi:PEBP-like protein [Mycena olivaceomarginata]|nr:PEBP-like protein [Mycena olivaceomarginata]